MKINSNVGSLIWAHRGRNRCAPENTMAAFRAALDAGDAGIELDVTLTSDRKIIVIHDDSVDRTTDGSGSVAEMNYTDLKKLDAGSWFDKRFRNECLPLLEDVLEETRGRTLVNIEIKHSAWRNTPEDGIEIPLLDLIENMRVVESVLISGFDWRSLRRIRSLNQEIALGVLAGTGWSPDKTAAFAEEISAFSIHPDMKDVIETMPGSYRKFEGCVYPYTATTRAAVEKLILAGAAGCFADLPFDPP
jgi:glycerophosphoryl diester phosphodiesterase